MGERPSFGAIVRDGSTEFDDPERFNAYVKRFEGKRVRIWIETERRARTIPQNKHLWAMYGEIWAQLFFDRDDITTEDIHEWAKIKFCPTIDIPMAGGEILKKRSTRLLSVEQMGEFTEKVMAHFAAEYGVEFDR